MKISSYRLIKLLLIILIVLTGFKIHTQEIPKQFEKSDSAGYIQVTGHVEKDYQTLDKAIIIMTENNKEIACLLTSATGIFKYKLPLNKFYKLEITKHGLVTKKFEFDTHIPDDVDNHTIFQFSFSIVLFSKYKNMEEGILDKPLALIKYDKKYNDFFYDFRYSKAMTDKLSVIQKKGEELSKEYNECIIEGNKLYNAKMYKKALLQFQRAHSIFHDEPEPITNIKTIKSILKKK